MCETSTRIKVLIVVLILALCGYHLISLAVPNFQNIYYTHDGSEEDVHEITTGSFTVDNGESVYNYNTTTRYIPNSFKNYTTIAIGLGITTRKAKLKTPGAPTLDEIDKFPFFLHLLPSFCKTCSESYVYRFYIAYDFNDSILSRTQNRELVSKHFKDTVKKSCGQNMKVELVLVKCSHRKKPAWAQNDAMIAAYMDNNDYYYRINDDTILESPKWTSRFIDVLKNYMPPNIGVVGPSYTYGNRQILTYDFVHRTHVDIFGFYYPRIFEGWHADRWISDVYKPGRNTKVADIRIKHTGSQGTRYPIHKMKKDSVFSVIKSDKETLTRYIAALDSLSASGETQSTSTQAKKVIAYSLADFSDSSFHGLIRNAVLHRLYYPTWRVRLYLSNLTALSNSVVQKLKFENVELIEVNSTLPSSLLSNLIADDRNIDCFIVRDPKCRLTRLESLMVDQWISSGKAIHAVKNNESEIIVPRFWGGKPSEFIKHGVSITKILQQYHNDLAVNQTIDSKMEKKILTKVFERDSFKFNMYDSVPCSKTVQFPSGNEQDLNIIGRYYNAFEKPTLEFILDFTHSCH